MGLFGGEKKEEPVSGQLEIDLVIAVSKAVFKATEEILKFALTDKPKIEQKPVVTWQGKMKIVKPSDYSYVSVQTIPRPNIKDNGIVVLFLPESTAEIIAGACGKKPSDGPEGIMSACGAYLDCLDKHFKDQLIKLGYEALQFSASSNFGSKVDQFFDYYRTTKYEILFPRKGEKFLQVELGIGPLKKTA